MDNIVYLPVEIKSRDFLNKLLLAYYLANDGFTIFIGRKKELEIMVNSYYPGIYFGINTQLNYLTFYQKIKNKKNKIFLFDEEGLVTLSAENYKNYKANDRILDVCDVFFCWGRKQYNKIFIRSPQKKKLVISGSLRIELLKKKYNSIFYKNVNKIKKKYKKFVLLVSSYGISNHFVNKENNLKAYLSNKNIKNKSVLLNYKYYYNFNNIRYKNFLKKIKKILYLKNYNFIIRPHPSENIETYSSLKKISKKIYISNEYSIIEWLKAANLVVHDYCTTAFEGFILKKKISYFPVNFKKKYIDEDVYNISNSLENLNLNLNFNKEKVSNFTKVKEHIYNLSTKSSVKMMLKLFRRNKIKNKKNLLREYKTKTLLNYYSLRKNKYTEYKNPSINIRECKEKLNLIHKVEKKKKFEKLKFFQRISY